jgi:hypothetical protein
MYLIENSATQKLELAECPTCICKDILTLIRPSRALFQDERNHNKPLLRPPVPKINRLLCADGRW